MIIKKFQRRTKEEALEAARKELGDGIVEMNVKTVKAKGLLGIFKGTLVEVTVAKEEENEKYGISSAKAQVQKADSAAAALSQGKIIPMKQPAKIAVGQGAQTPDLLPEETFTLKNASTGKMTVPQEQPKGRILEEKLDTLQSLLEKQLSQQQHEKEREKEKEQERENESSREKDVPEEVRKKEEEVKTRVNFLRLLYNKLIDNEVHEKYANEIIDEIDKNCKPDVTMDFMLSEIYQRMILKFGKPYMLDGGEEKGPKVIFFVGPTGVGKTTTIAKIASSFRVEQKKKVALLTADTYRIAAAEQLRTYANILEVPFRVVYTAQEISQSIESFRDYDYILVDTTGHSPNNEAQRESMGELISQVETSAPKEVFLVLSASTKYRDLMKIADTYKEIMDYKLIFTKLDETSTLGNIYNLKMYTGAALSYVTCGQNVPDDIEYFNPQATVKQLLGGRR